MRLRFEPCLLIQSAVHIRTRVPKAGSVEHTLPPKGVQLSVSGGTIQGQMTQLLVLAWQLSSCVSFDKSINLSELSVAVWGCNHIH